MLNVDNLVVRYGAVSAVRDLSLKVGRGELVALLGPNGAGKSSTINALTGLVTPASGRIVLDGQDISRVRTEDRIRAGLTSTPEGRHIFANLTVGENLRLGAAIRRDPKGVRGDIERFLALFPVLGERYGASGRQRCRAASSRSSQWPWSLLVAADSACCSTSRRSGCRRRSSVQIFDSIGRAHRREGVDAAGGRAERQAGPALCRPRLCRQRRHASL